MHEEQDDITLDTEEGIDDSVLTEEAQGDTIKKLKTKLKLAEAKAKEHLDGWQKAQADFMNARKRDEEVKSEFARFAKSNTLESLIPVLDSFEMALSHGHEEMRPIHSQFLQVLKQNGLEEHDPKGRMFDPKSEEAIGLLSTDKKEEDHLVLEVLQKGYILDGKVIRPAKVRVGEYTA